MSGPGWLTRSDIAQAAGRFHAALAGWKPPAAYGIAALSSAGATFPVVNVGTHGLPALVAATVTGHRSGNGSYLLAPDQLARMIELLAPAEACADYEHPNLAAWRDLARAGAPTAMVFLDDLDPSTAGDALQIELAKRARCQPLAGELPLTSIGSLIASLERATERLVDAARAHVELLAQPSALAGWSRIMVLAHLRYVAEAMTRMTRGALAGRAEHIYPNGRAADRPATLELREGETAGALVHSFHTGASDLHAAWRSLTLSDWDRRLVDRDHGPIALRRLLALRLTEIEVHSVDLALPGLDTWSDAFVDALLPLRIAWLASARRRDDADLTLNGAWALTDRTSKWLVDARGAEVRAGEVDLARSADCTLSGSRRDLLALILGRSHRVELAGLPELAHGFKAAFPGP